jgi:hypothetical protein
VEGEGGQFRRNYLVPVPSVQRLEELNLLLAAGSREEQNRVIEGRAQTIGAGMIAGWEHLLPLADEGFDLASLHFPEINASGCAKALTNFHCCPAITGIESTGCRHGVNRTRCQTLEVPVEWAFSQKRNTQIL